MRGSQQSGIELVDVGTWGETTNFYAAAQLLAGKRPENGVCKLPIPKTGYCRQPGRPTTALNKQQEYMSYQPPPGMPDNSIRKDKQPILDRVAEYFKSFLSQTNSTGTAILESFPTMRIPDILDQASPSQKRCPSSRALTTTKAQDLVGFEPSP